MLTGLVLLPLLGGVLGGVMEDWRKFREVGIKIAVVEYIWALGMWVGLDGGSGEFGYVEDWGEVGFMHVVLGVDGISMSLMVLTSYLMIPVLLTPPSGVGSGRRYMITVLILESMGMGLFGILDLMIFYILYESMLIPLLVMVGVWGGERRIGAAYQLFMYTLMGSLGMLVGIMVMYMETGTTDYIYMRGVLSTMEWEGKVEKILWVLLFVGLGVKIPVYPIHIWLPEAHSEAPTGGSMILAGVILKVGGYGMIRWMIPMLSGGTEYFRPMIYMIGMVGMIYTSMACIRQVDVKRVVAYSSVAHMNVGMMGIFSGEMEGVLGGVVMMLSHGVVSSTLFGVVGMLYRRYGSRVMRYYRGVGIWMPWMGVMIMILNLANMGIPLTSSFVGEVLIYMGLMEGNRVVGVISAISMILGGVYSIWMVNRVVFGEVSVYMRGYRDMTRGEMGRVIPSIIWIFILGVIPGGMIGKLGMELTTL